MKVLKKMKNSITEMPSSAESSDKSIDYVIHPVVTAMKTSEVSAYREEVGFMIFLYGTTSPGILLYGISELDHNPDLRCYRPVL